MPDSEVFVFFISWLNLYLIRRIGCKILNVDGLKSWVANDPSPIIWYSKANRYKAYPPIPLRVILKHSQFAWDRKECIETWEMK